MWDDMYEVVFYYKAGGKEIMEFWDKEPAMEVFTVHKNDSISQELYKSIAVYYHGEAIVKWIG